MIKIFCWLHLTNIKRTKNFNFIYLFSVFSRWVYHFSKRWKLENKKLFLGNSTYCINQLRINIIYYIIILHQTWIIQCRWIILFLNFESLEWNVFLQILTMRLVSSNGLEKIRLNPESERASQHDFIFSAFMYHFESRSDSSVLY